jgi:tetratricopeptide (TPR) repeat protein
MTRPRARQFFCEAECDARAAGRLFLPLLVAIACVTFLVSGGFSATDDRSSAAAHANLGLQLAQQGDLVHAQEELRQAADLAPDDAEILASLGTVLAMQKKLEESSSVFKRALKISPHDWTVRRYLAANLWQLQRYPESKQNLDILLKENPGDEAARLLMGMVSENMKDYATAARMLSSVPDQVGQQPESIAALARSYYHLGQTQNARTTLANLSGHPAGAQAAFLGAGVADEMRDYETAEKLLLSVDPGFPDQKTLGYRLALVQYHAAKFEAAQQTLLGLLEAGHTSGQIYNLLGWSYHRQHRSKEAIEALTQAVNLAPEDETNYQDLGEFLVAERSLPLALELARKATAAFPHSARMFELEGSVETKMGQFADAMHSYSRAVELDPSRSGGTLGLAQAQFAAGKVEQAMASLDSGIMRFPKNAPLKILYASVLLKQAETTDPQMNRRRAEEMLRAALTLDPSQAGAHYELGKLSLKEGRLPEALVHLKKAVKLDPQNEESHFALSRAYRRAGRKEEAAKEMETYEKLKRE